MVHLASCVMMCFLYIFLSFNYYFKFFSVTHSGAQCLFLAQHSNMITQGKCLLLPISPAPNIIPEVSVIHLHAILEDFTLRTFHALSYRTYLYTRVPPALFTFSLVFILLYTQPTRHKCLWFSEILSLPLFRGHICFS